MVREILLLGDKELYKRSEDVNENELTQIKELIEDLHDTLINYRTKHGAGRAIAAPQIGVKKRLIYMCIDKPEVFINPIISYKSQEMMVVFDDCLSFPGLLVKVLRHKQIELTYKNLNFEDCTATFEGDLAELLQHECDHLDGVLATMRAIDSKSLKMAGAAD